MAIDNSGVSREKPRSSPAINGEVASQTRLRFENEKNLDHSLHSDRSLPIQRSSTIKISQWNILELEIAAV
jgi:hypothetical protein